MRLIVTGLSNEVGKKELRSFFKTFGTVEKASIDKRRKGGGFVEMADDAEARWALKQARGKTLRGKRVFVKEQELE